MVLPLANYLRLQTRRSWLALGTLAGMVLTVLAVVGSYSRGALLALAAVALVGVFRTKRWFVYLGLVAILAVPAYNFMPASFHDRVQSISNADDDASFQGRVDAWEVAFDVALDHFPMGAGFYGPQRHAIFHHYLPDAEAHAAHSIYFQVLGEHGFVGLAIYLALLVAAFLNTVRLRRLTRDHSELRWVFDLASMIQVSLVAFCVGGAALSLAYYDVFIVEVALLLPLMKIARDMVKAKRKTERDAGQPSLALPVPA
jgi:probable O-glycosylation ligase (exosortase A-associated)